MTTPPTVASLVHFIVPGSAEHRAALVTRISGDNGQVDLAVFHPTGLVFDYTIPHDPDAAGDRTWHWPETVIQPRLEDGTLADYAYQGKTTTSGQVSSPVGVRRPEPVHTSDPQTLPTEPLI